MNQGFKSLKNKIIIQFIIKCIVLSFSFGLILFGILFTLWKLDILNIKIWLIIIISLLLFIISSCTLIFIFKPSDKKIAKIIDDTYQLNEKVQTMIDYKDSEEFLVALQREDTQNKLQSLSLKALKFPISAFLIVIATIGLCSTTVSTIVPNKRQKDEPIEEEPPYNPTDYQKYIINNLISKLKDASISDSCKEKYSQSLDELYELLNISTNEVEIKNKVNMTISDILETLTEENKSKKIGYALNAISPVKYGDESKKNAFTVRSNSFVGYYQTDDEKPLKINITKTTVNINGQTYAFEEELTKKKYSIGDTITAYTPGTKEEEITITLGDNLIMYNDKEYYLYEPFFNIHGLGRGIYNFEASLSNRFSAILEEYNSYIDSKSLYGGNYAYAKTYYEGITLKTSLESLNLEGYVLYDELMIYANFLIGAQDIASSKLKESLQEAILNLEQAITETYQIEKENQELAYEIEDILRDLFELDQAQRNDTLEDTDSIYNKEEDKSSSDIDGDLSSGGLGSGQTNYASNDYFFHYDESTGEAKFYAYGEFYLTYQAYFEALSNEGVLTDEMREYIESYFEKLNTGLTGNKNE